MDLHTAGISTVNTHSTIEVPSPIAVRLASVNTSACESDLLAETSLRFRSSRNRAIKLIFKKSRDMYRRMNGVVTKNSIKIGNNTPFKDNEKLTDKEDPDDIDPCFNEESQMQPIGFRYIDRKLALSPNLFMKSGKISIDIHMGTEAKSRPDSRGENTFKVKSFTKYCMTRLTPQILSTDYKLCDFPHKTEVTDSKTSDWNDDFLPSNRSPSVRKGRSVSVNKPRFPESICVAKRNSTSNPYKRRVRRFFPKSTAENIRREVQSAMRSPNPKFCNKNPWKLADNSIEGKAIFDAMDLVSKCNSYKLRGTKYNNKC